MAQRKTSDTSASAALNDARMLKSSARPLWLAFCSGDKVRSKKSVKIRTCLNTPTARLPDLSPVKCGGHCVQRNSELFNRPQEDEIGSESKYLACAPENTDRSCETPSAGRRPCLGSLRFNVQRRLVKALRQEPESLDVSISRLCCSNAERQDSPSRWWSRCGSGWPRWASRRWRPDSLCPSEPEPQWLPALRSSSPLRVGSRQYPFLTWSGMEFPMMVSTIPLRPAASWTSLPEKMAGLEVVA